MSSTNPFLKELDNYQRDYDLLGHTKSQISKYISTMLNVDKETADEFVRKKMSEKGSKFEFIDPPMQRLYKVRRGEREVQVVGFVEYVNEAIQQDLIMSPSMVTYLPPSVRKSTTAKWCDTNIELRREAKNAMFVLKQAGDDLGSQLKNYEQNSKKIRINSVSGMRAFKGNPLYLATGHSTLTSTCRAAAGYGNATIERFISGARHYHTPEIVKANILTTINVKNSDSYREVIEKYNLVYPDTDQTMEVIHGSTDMYFRNVDEMAEIREFVSKLTGLERALFCYSGDFYHIRKFNDEFARQFVSDMIVSDLSSISDVDPDAAMASLNKTDIAYVNSLRADVLAGSTHKDVKAKDPEGWVKIGKTSQAVQNSLDKYADFIGHFFAVEHLPPTVASIRSIQRKAALTADTDSSIFTTQEWIQWYTGSLKRTETADAVWYLITYMGCQCIAHSLAMLSANMNVERQVVFRISMKNEYAFPQFAITGASKNYFCNMSMREGNVFEKMELDVKGVGLRGSEYPPITLERTDALMVEILGKINDSILIDEVELLNRISSWEKETVRSILNGEYTFLKSSNINPNTVNEIYYNFWEYVLSDKYGTAGELPVPTVSVNLTLNNKTDLINFTKSLNEKDPDMARKFASWIDKNRRTNLTSMRFPVMNLAGLGIPPEFREVVDYRKIVYQVSKPFYMILETLGLNIVDKDYHQLVTDYLGEDLVDLDVLQGSIDNDRSDKDQ